MVFTIWLVHRVVGATFGSCTVWVVHRVVGAP